MQAHLASLYQQLDQARADFFAAHPEIQQDNQSSNSEQQQLDAFKAKVLRAAEVIKDVVKEQQAEAAQGAAAQSSSDAGKSSSEKQ